MTLLSLFRQAANVLASMPAGGMRRRARSAAGADSEVEQRILDKRYSLFLKSGQSPVVEPSLLASAWTELEQYMALVPGGEVTLAATAFSMNMGDPAAPLDKQTVAVSALYLDRYAVSNADFARFVAAGGYSQEELWPATPLSQLLQFVDRTARPGPKYWSDGKPPQDKLQHPVVGICWYEAHAYARWAGKQLPTPAEWQRAGTWSSSGEHGEVRYPWGNAFDPKRANTWLGGVIDTVPVDAYYDGATSNGIFQLSGNVWEWMADSFECSSGDPGLRVVLDAPMAEIRGGAFDTYFETQATCQFRTGQPLLTRTHNVGFRCCVRVADLQPPPHPSAFLEGAR